MSVCRHARESGILFLGTCGGFQHAIPELAQTVFGLKSATHAELNPRGAECVISRLSCGLVEVRGTVRFLAGSRLRKWVGSDDAEEVYHCRFGVNPEYRAPQERAGFHFTAFDAAGDIRGEEWLPHRFFAGTLFEPDRAGLEGRVHLLVRAWIHASRQDAA